MIEKHIDSQEQNIDSKKKVSYKYSFETHKEIIWLVIYIYYHLILDKYIEYIIR